MLKDETFFSIRRSIRKFSQEGIPKDIIEQVISWARLSPSAKNLQPVRFVATIDKEIISETLPYMKWAGYISPKRNPTPDTMPTGLILVCHDKCIADERYIAYDIGACVQTILLGLVFLGYGGCWIGAIDRHKISHLFDLPKNWELHCVVAAGLPAEKPVITDVEGDDIKYFLDDSDTLIVPKRKLDEVLSWR